MNKKLLLIIFASILSITRYNFAVDGDHATHAASNNSQVRCPNPLCPDPYNCPTAQLLRAMGVTNPPATQAQTQQSATLQRLQQELQELAARRYASFYLRINQQ